MTQKKLNKTDVLKRITDLKEEEMEPPFQNWLMFLERSIKNNLLRYYPYIYYSPDHKEITTEWGYNNHDITLTFDGSTYVELYVLDLKNNIDFYMYFDITCHINDMWEFIQKELWFIKIR